MLQPEEFPELDPKTNHVSHADIRSVEAEMVRMHQADAEAVAAAHVEMQQSAAGSVKAEQLSTNQSAMANVDADEIVAQQSFLGTVRAEKADISGYTGAVVAGSADIHHSLVGYVAGTDINVEDNTRTVLLVARNVRGNVTTLMDNRSALIAGLTGGLFAGLMLLLGRVLFRRR